MDQAGAVASGPVGDHAGFDEKIPIVGKSCVLCGNIRSRKGRSLIPLDEHHDLIRRKVVCRLLRITPRAGA